MGVTKELVKSGSGPLPRVDQVATYHVVVLGKNGDPTKEFWSTRNGYPLAATVGYDDFIPAIDEGLLKMQVGEVARLSCTPDWAFGSHGDEHVPPNTPVVLEIELLRLEDDVDGLLTLAGGEEPEEEV